MTKTETVNHFKNTCINLYV